MSVEIEILGSGAFAGAKANVVDYSITEDASPLSLHELQGGVGSVSFDAVEDTAFNGSMLLPRQPFRLTDSTAGRLRGIIDSGTGSNDVQLNVEASGLLLPLVSRRALPATSGALGSVLSQWMTACGMGDTPLQMDPTLALKQVNLPSWEGEVWAQIKKLMAIHSFEMAVVDGTIIVRKLRQRKIDATRYTSKRISYGSDSAYQTVEVYYYNNQWKANTQVYPPIDSSIVDREIIQVGASETTVTNVPVDMWLSSIDTPEHTLSLPWDTKNVTESAYSVVDKDGKPVSVKDWKNGGGMISVAIGADRKSIDITVRGMSTNARAPYRIAGSSDDREYQYAALYIAATGIAFKREMVWSPTGADLIDAPVDSILTIDDPMVSTIADAYNVLSNAALRANGFSQTFEADTTHVNRRGEVGAFLYPTFSDFNASRPAGETFAQFNAAHAGVKFSQFTKTQAALVQDDFANQAFGGIAGARVRERDCMYRITNGRATPGGFSWSAQFDTLFSEFNTVNTGQTFAQYNARWSGKTFEQFARMPLYAP